MHATAGADPVPNAMHGDTQAAPVAPAFRSSEGFNHKAWKEGVEKQYPSAPKPKPREE